MLSIGHLEDRARTQASFLTTSDTPIGFHPEESVTQAALDAGAAEIAAHLSWSLIEQAGPLPVEPAMKLGWRPPAERRPEHPHRTVCWLTISSSALNPDALGMGCGSPGGSGVMPSVCVTATWAAVIALAAARSRPVGMQLAVARAGRSW